MTRSKIKGFFVGLAVAISTVAFAATFDYFSPATGVLKGSASTYVTTAAASSDIRALWSGTCNASSFLRGDGACAATGTVTSVGLTMPSGFSVAGSPVTGSGTLAVTTALNGVIHGNGSAFTASNVVLTSEVSGILPTANGGTANGFFAVTGPATATRTFTFPNADATVLTTNAAVTVPQGGTGITSGTSGGIPYFSSTTSIASSGLLTANALLLGGGAGTSPTVLGSLGTTTTVLHGNAAGAPTFGAVTNSDLQNSSITINGTSVSLGGTRTLTLASADFANQGTTTTVLHGNAAGNPSFGAVSLTADVSGVLPVANGGTNLNASADDNVMVGNGTTWETKAVPDCDNSGSNHLNYDTGTNAFTCGTSPVGARASVACTGGGCTLNGTSNFGVTSVTRNAAGNYTVNFSVTFTDEPVCVATEKYSSTFTSSAFMGSVTTTTVVVLIGQQGTPMTTQEGDFNIICQGL